MSIQGLANDVRGVALCPDASGSLRGRFLKGAFWSLVGAAASRGLTLAGAVGAARLLGSKGLGELGLVQSTTSTFIAVAGMGMGLAATKLVAEARANSPGLAGAYIRHCLLVTLAAGLVLAVVYLLALPILGTALPPGGDLQPALQVGTALLVFGALGGTGLGVLAGLEAFRAAANVGVVRGLLSAAFMIAGVAVSGVVGGVAGLALAEAIGTLLVLYTVGREARARGICVRTSGPTHGVGAGLWRFSLPALLGSAVVLSAMWIANLQLVRDGGYEQMGIYAAALRWNQAILFLPSSIAGIVLPMLANRHGAGDEAEFRGLFRLSIAVNVGVTILPAGLVLLGSRSLMRLCGPDYEAGWPVLAVLAAAAVPTVLNNVLGQAIVSRGSIGWRTAIDALMALTLVTASWWLVPSRAALGMATATALSFTVAAAALAAALQRHSGRTTDERAPRG